MSPEELHRLIEEYRDGSISDADARRLAEAIRGDARIAQRVRRELAFTGHLGQSLDSSDDAAFARSFNERVAAERGGDAFRVEFEKRTSLRARTRRVSPPRPSRVPFLVAAAFLLAILAAVVWQKQQQPAPSVIIVKQPPPPTAPPEIPDPEPQPVPPPKPEPVEPKETPKPEPPPPPKTEPAPKPETPKPPPARAPEPPKPVPPVKPVESTRVIAVARLDKVEGAVFIGDDRRPAKAGEDAASGLRVAAGSAHLVLADGTRLTVGPGATIREIAKGLKGTRVEIVVGTITADIARQPADQPLTFATPHAEVRVVGTVLRLVVEAASTRLEVKEGKVQLTRDGKTVVVAAGQFAVAAPGQPMTPRSISPDEIVLYPHQAKLTGAEWTLVREPKALSSVGVVLEAAVAPYKVTDHVQTRPSYATFTFYAPADKEYRIWMRLTSQEKGDPWLRDAVTIEPLKGTMNQRSPFFGAAPTTAWVVTGAAATPGFTWISSHGDAERANVPPISVKFHETGFQTIRLFTGQPAVRVDAIWLSATQKTRPGPKVLPPAER
jgi:hypothetical protein